MSSKKISTSELKRLLLRDERLRRLEEGGVDNWTWYGYALGIGGEIQDWYQESLPEILDAYEDLNN